MDAPPSFHPTDQTLNGYGLGKLGDSSAEAVRKHLEECPACRLRVTETTSDSFLSRLRDAQAPPKDVLSKDARFDQSSAERGRREPADPSIQPAAHTLPSGLAEHPDYEVQRELGRGGMGVVYLAHNRLMGRNEVLKVVGRHVLERPGVLDRFLREIRAVANLRHANIVTAYSAFRLGDSIVFAMEYVEGLDLARLAKAKGPIPVAHACSFAHQAALGLQHAHKQGMVHRDIKPGNLMLSRREGRAIVQILDFGLAKVAREGPVDSGLTHEGQLLGTPDFIAPEQSIDAQKADIRADIYSLGCTLYYLLTGGPPFRGRSLYDILQAHHSIDARPVNLVRPEVQVELAAIIARMMAKEPDRRFQTPGEVAEALAPFFKKGSTGSTGPRAELSQSRPSGAPKESAGAFSVPTRSESSSSSAAGPLANAPEVAPHPESRWTSLLDLHDEAGPTKPAEVAVRGRRPPWLWPSAAAGLLLVGFLVAWAAGVFRVKTRDGVIVLENVPEQADVFVDGDKVTLHLPDGGAPLEITVPAGKRGVQVKKNGFKTFGQEVTVEAGANKEIRVALIPLTDSSAAQLESSTASKPTERPGSAKAAESPVKPTESPAKPPERLAGTSERPAGPASPPASSPSRPAAAKTYPRNRWIALDPAKAHINGRGKAENGVLMLNPPPGRGTGVGWTNPSISGRNMILRARVKLPEWNGQNSLDLKLREDPHDWWIHYEASIAKSSDRKGYSVRIWKFYVEGTARRQIELKQSAIRRAPNLDADGFFEFGFSAIGDNLSVTVNGNRVVGARDFDLKEGEIALGSWQCRGFIKDVEVKILDD